MPPFAPHPQIETDSIFLRDLPLSQLRLQDRTAVPWLLLIPKRDGITEIYQLTETDRTQLMNEIALASKALEKLFKPHKINVAALGNIVPQLHIHVIARFTNDPAWPQPVWGKLAPNPYSAEALDAIKRRLGDTTLWR